MEPGLDLGWMTRERLEPGLAEKRMERMEPGPNQTKRKRMEPNSGLSQILRQSVRKRNNEPPEVPHQPPGPLPKPRLAEGLGLG